MFTGPCRRSRVPACRFACTAWQRAGSHLITIENSRTRTLRVGPRSPRFFTAYEGKARVEASMLGIDVTTVGATHRPLIDRVSSPRRAEVELIAHDSR